MFLDEADVPHRRCDGLTAFMCILDNHPTARANPRMIRKRLQGLRSDITTLWWLAHGTRWDGGW
jgi:hypothetical protein